MTPRTNQAPAWLVWAIGAFLVAVGAAIGFVANYMADQAEAAKSWPTAQGRIVSSKVVSREDRNDGGGTTTMYSLEVVYEYDVDGETHRCKNIRPKGMMTSSSSSRSDAQEDAAEYPVGSARTVYYDPANPADACLVPDAGAGPWVLMAVAVAVFLAGAGVLVYKARGVLVPPARPEEPAPF